MLIIDPEREYTALANGFDGEVIHISADSPCHLNPMDLSDNYADDDNLISLKSDFIMSICDLCPAVCSVVKTPSSTVLSVFRTKSISIKTVTLFLH